MARLTQLLGLAFSSSILCSTLSTRDGKSPILQARQLELNSLPSIDDFLSISYHSAIVLNNYLYLDGGEIVFLYEGAVVHVPLNETYSIDLSTSWTNKTVTLNRIKKSVPVLNQAALWADATNASFYAWGGGVNQVPPLTPVPQNLVWKFTRSNGGAGSWSEQAMSSNSIFPSLTRPAGGASTYGNGTGYLMGGFASKRTTPQTADLQDLVPIPGIVSYNTVDGTWKNESSTGYSAFGTAVLAQLQYVPTFGAGGLLLVMGGSTPNAVKWTDRGSNYVSFEKVNIYDLASKSWHAQTASGAIPNARSRFCSVGARGDNGTYEIFIFGGHVASASGESLASDTEAQKKRNIALDEVLVLSLPGFVWTKANYTAATPRVMHACNIAGNRQMVVTGGLNPATADQKQLLSTRDNWTQGIGVFDMTTLQWKDSYDADAEAYVTPEVVKSWYAANGAYPATWDNAVVEGLFTQSAGSSSSGADPSSNASGSDSSSGNADSSKPNTATIAGGVVGGILGLVLFAALAWFLLRRRPVNPAPPANPEGRQFKAELGTDAPRHKPLDTSKHLSVSEESQVMTVQDCQNPPRQELP